MVLDHEVARGWADNHQAFTTSIAALVRDIAQSFRVLQRIQYDRPWLRTARRAGRTAGRARVQVAEASSCRW